MTTFVFFFLPGDSFFLPSGEGGDRRKVLIPISWQAWEEFNADFLPWGCIAFYNRQRIRYSNSPKQIPLQKARSTIFRQLQGKLIFHDGGFTVFLQVQVVST